MYLGSLLHFSLRDTPDVDRRIFRANQVMGALRFFWQRPEVEIWAKATIYKSCVLTILLWGSETWALSKTDESRLEVFHHRSIRSILGISMLEVRDERIHNDNVRVRFNNTPPLRDILRSRKLLHLGNIAQSRRVASMTLSTWINRSRPKGRPRCTTLSTTLRYIHEILPGVVVHEGDIAS